MKPLGILFAAVAMTLGASFFITPSTTLAFGNQGLKNECAWWRKKAMAAGRKGNTKQSEAYWERYRQCMKGWG